MKHNRCVLFTFKNYMIDQELTGIFDGGIINAAETDQEESPCISLI